MTAEARFGLRLVAEVRRLRGLIAGHYAPRFPEEGELAADALMAEARAIREEQGR